MKKYSLELLRRVQGVDLYIYRSMVQGLANRPLFGEGQEVSSTFPEVSCLRRITDVDNNGNKGDK